MIPDDLVVANGTSTLSSETIWGILRALESFSQLLVVTDDRLSVSDRNPVIRNVEYSALAKKCAFSCE